ncbi:UDP-glucosyltransferase 2 [Amyelois transitella]|uniref:UDP-glucosyltransferase 2 n=1 Tax=Amyelois transitella TaxID=680683 RepID=UPI00299068F0|nr:UDP-glucosyltransferase 2 [Amyelois transitella]XP_060805984.1 UDP-glucosyltransferase 2 [Amyelois transitella]
MPPHWMCFLLLVVPSGALRVLVVFPFTSPSHNLLGRSVVRHLLDANHEVVHITSFPYKTAKENLTEISIEALGAQILEEIENARVYSVKNLVGHKNDFNAIKKLYFPYDFHKRTLDNENMTKFLSDPREKFDVVLIEWFFSDLFAGIPPLFQCPFIWMASTDAHWQVLSLVGEVPNPAYTPDIFDLSPTASLWDRVCSLAYFVKKYFLSKIFFATLEKSTYNAVYPSIAVKRGVSMPSYEDAVYNASMLFINSHPALGMPHNIPLNAKYIGGYHMDTDLKSMPTHLQNIMDNANHGVIYFSLGTNLESRLMSGDMISSLLTMFSKLKQAVIWKFEEHLKNVPKNVYLARWAPQLNILAHPNLKIFITHSGRMSLTEAVHYGVPVIGIPMYADQFLNIKACVKKHVGLEVTLKENLADDLMDAITEILNNRTYTDKALELSMTYNHRPLTPGQELVYWAEHTVISKGARHLRPTTQEVFLYQKSYIDLILVVIFIGSFICFVCSFIRKKLNTVKEKRN